MTPSSPALTVIDGGRKEPSDSKEPEFSAVLTAWRAFQHAKLEALHIEEQARRRAQELQDSKVQELQRALLEAHLSGTCLREELEDIDGTLVSVLDATLGAVL